MILEPEIAEFVSLYESFDPLAGDDALSPPRHRARYRRLIERVESDPPLGVACEDVELDCAGHTVPMRIYRTDDGPAQGACLFFHGGGWILGDLDTHHSWAADLCAASGATVIAVDYRLAPENPYPAAFDDCFAALTAVARDAERYRVDPARIAVYGDSAGGNLSAAVCLKARDTGGPKVAGQVLVYPALHWGDPLPSWQENRDAPILTLPALQACWRAYLGGGDADPYAAPLLASDLGSLPPAWIVTAEHDPLRDDGLRFAEGLRATGGAAEIFDVAGLVHGCFRVRHTSTTTRDAFNWSVQAVREALCITIQAP